jgi:hypothetical protein
MEMVGEDDEGIDPPGATDHGAAEGVLEPAAVVIIADDVLAVVAAGHDVVDRAGILQS